MGRRGKDPNKIQITFDKSSSSLELFYTHQTFTERVMGKIQNAKVCLKAVHWVLDSFLKAASALLQHKLNYFFCQELGPNRCSVFRNFTKIFSSECTLPQSTCIARALEMENTIEQFWQCYFNSVTTHSFALKK